MAYVNYHTQKYTDNSELESQLTSVSNTILAFVQNNILQDFNTVAPMDKVYNPYLIVQEYNYSAPIAVNKKYPRLTEFNEYSWEIENEELYILGDRFLGNWESSKLPYTVISENNIVADMLSSSILSVIKNEDFSEGYAYLRMTQSLIKLSMEDQQSVINVRPQGRSIKLRS